MSAVVYRHFGADGQLLYVGCSLIVFTRTMQHCYGSAWGNLISKIDLTHFSSRAEALQAEREAILREQPIHNIAGLKPKLEHVRAAQKYCRDCGEPTGRHHHALRCMGCLRVHLKGSWPKQSMRELRDLKPDWFTGAPFPTADKANGDTVIVEPKLA